MCTIDYAHFGLACPFFLIKNSWLAASPMSMRAKALLPLTLLAQRRCLLETDTL